jgi:hypothetical protein
VLTRALPRMQAAPELPGRSILIGGAAGADGVETGSGAGGGRSGGGTGRGVGVGAVLVPTVRVDRCINQRPSRG